MTITKEQIFAQIIPTPLPPLAVEQAWPKKIIERIDAASAMYPAGSHEHGQVVRAALESAWPELRSILISQFKLQPWFR